MPPACWVLIDDYSPFSTVAKNSDLVGTWDVRAQTLYGEQEWFTTFRETENGLEGEVHLDETQTPIQDIVIDSSAVFGRVLISGSFFIMTGTVERSLLRGQLDIREGIYATFEGMRR